jgi:hypothetical protein
VLDIGVPGCEDASEIGRGGFGVVYRARQPAISRTVAVKVLAADRLDVDARRRFELEVRAMGRLGGHPHIVTVHQAGFTAGGNPYILMAFEEGGSLARRGRASSWAEVVAGGIAIAGALESAHRAGVLHRDVTPGNILVSRFGELKLADFGLARPVRRQTAPTGRVTATRLHAAPEVLRGEPATVASDVYALASTVRWWLGDAEAPPGVWDALAHALALDPASRSASAATFGQELQAVQHAAGLPVSPLVLDNPAPASPTGSGRSPAGPVAPEASAQRPPADGVPGPSTPIAGQEQPDAVWAGGAGAAGRWGELSATVATGVVSLPKKGPKAIAGLAFAGLALLAVVGGDEAVRSLPVEAAAMDLGGHQTGAEPEERILDVRNRGNRPALVDTITLTGEDFRIVRDGCGGQALPPGASCPVRVAFAPTGAGARKGILRLPGRDVAMTGTGVLRFAEEDDAPPGGCYADAFQVGHTAYGYVGGQKAISVKQYWSPSCRTVMAYAWVWKQYRDNAGARGTWTVVLGAAGATRRAVGQPLELWTAPAKTAACGSATATMTGTGLAGPLAVRTEEDCP